MNARGKTRGFRIRRTAKDWVKDPDVWRQQLPPLKGEIYTARLTVDVTPELRRKLRAAALRADCAMSVIVRRLLEAQLSKPADPDSGSASKKSFLHALEDVTEAS
jgi:hypothetical protein